MKNIIAIIAVCLISTSAFAGLNGFLLHGLTTGTIPQGASSWSYTIITGTATVTDSNSYTPGAIAASFTASIAEGQIWYPIFITTATNSLVYVHYNK